MSNKAERLTTLIQELRGSLSQGQFARKLGVSRPAVSMWESCQSWPEAENLQKLALLKGWNLEEIQAYLADGQLPSSDPVEQILSKVRTLPTEAVAQIAAVAVQTLVARTGCANGQSSNVA